MSVCDFDGEDDVEVIRDEDCTRFEMKTYKNREESREKRLRVHGSEGAVTSMNSDVTRGVFIV